MTAMCWLKLLISTGESIWPSIYPLAPHGNLAWIGSDWKLSGAQKPVQSAEGNVCMKASNRCSRQLPWAETIRAKVAAHQASGFSAFCTSNYLGDPTFREPADIWLPIKPPAPELLSFLFTTHRMIALHHLLCCCIMMLVNVDQSFIKALFQREMSWWLHHTCVE